VITLVETHVESHDPTTENVCGSRRAASHYRTSGTGNCILSMGGSTAACTGAEIHGD
jgi:hypothetical protein